MISARHSSVNETTPELLLAWHWLTTADGFRPGLNAFFSTLRRKPRPAEAEARAAIEKSSLKDTPA